MLLQGSDVNKGNSIFSWVAFYIWILAHLSKSKSIHNSEIFILHTFSSSPYSRRIKRKHFSLLYKPYTLHIAVQCFFFAFVKFWFSHYLNFSRVWLRGVCLSRRRVSAVALVSRQAHATVAKYKLRDKNKTIVSLDIVQYCANSKILTAGQMRLKKELKICYNISN